MRQCPTAKLIIDTKKVVEREIAAFPALENAILELTLYPPPPVKIIQKNNKQIRTSGWSFYNYV